MHLRAAGNDDPARRAGILLAPEVRPETGAAQVWRDMEGIFGRADRVPSGEIPAASPVAERIVARSAPRRSGRGRALALAGVVIAGVVAVSIVLAQRGMPGRSPAQVARPLPALAVQVDPVPSGPAIVQPQAVAAAPTSSARKAAPKPAAAVKPHPKPSVAVHRPKPRPKPTERLAAEPVSSAPSPQATPSCERMGGLDLARCMRPQILDADQQLRTAYQDAVRSGVDKRVLSGYRRQWKKLRSRANSDPRSVESGYRAMARQLDAARTVRRADDI